MAKLLRRLSWWCRKMRHHPRVLLLGGHLPFVFTQEGIAMLSGVLRSPRAVRANIEIMRSFVYTKTRERWRSVASARAVAAFAIRMLPIPGKYISTIRGG